MKSRQQQVEFLINTFEGLTITTEEAALWQVRATLEVARQLAIANDQYQPPEASR